jgi:predicted O-methyltransferase YrrM
VLEFGSGLSTLWFAARFGRIESIEHEDARARAAAEAVRAAGLEKFGTVRHVSPELCAREAGAFADDAFDLVVLADAIRPADCATAALPRLRPGGWLVVNHANRHLPGSCPGPGSLRRFDLSDAEHVKWRDLRERFDTWERMPTSNGVWETLLLRKPA